MIDLNKKWSTFQGRTVTFGTIDHQHLSNIFYYWKYILSSREEDLQDLQKIADERFNGQFLPYRPHSKFKFEIDTLSKKGMLLPEGKKILIIVEGIEIGEIITLDNFIPFIPPSSDKEKTDLRFTE